LVTAQVLKETLKQPPPIKIHPRVPAFSANRAFASASLIGRSWPLTADWPIGIKRRYQPSMAKDGALKIGATISPEMTRLDLQRQPEAGSIILETAVEHARGRGGEAGWEGATTSHAGAWRGEATQPDGFSTPKAGV
jgi:hypothetical protein